MALTAAGQRWSDLIDQHEASGLTIRAFAEQNEVNPRTLAWWRCRLGRAKKRPKPDFVELTVAHLPVNGEERRPVVVLALDRFPAHVVIDHQTDLTLLRRVLDALC